MLINVVFVIRCLHSTVSLTLVKDQHFTSIIYCYYFLRDFQEATDERNLCQMYIGWAAYMWTTLPPLLHTVASLADQSVFGNYHMIAWGYLLHNFHWQTVTAWEGRGGVIGYTTFTGRRSEERGCVWLHNFPWLTGREERRGGVIGSTTFTGWRGEKRGSVFGCVTFTGWQGEKKGRAVFGYTTFPGWQGEKRGSVTGYTAFTDWQGKKKGGAVCLATQFLQADGVRRRAVCLATQFSLAARARRRVVCSLLTFCSGLS